MDMQQAQMIFTTEVMPKIMQGFGVGFDCSWKNEIIAMAEQKLADYLNTFGMEFLTQGVIAVVDWALATFGLKEDCDAVSVSDNALF